MYMLIYTDGTDIIPRMFADRKSAYTAMMTHSNEEFKKHNTDGSLDYRKVLNGVNIDSESIERCRAWLIASGSTLESTYMFHAMTMPYDNGKAASIITFEWCGADKKMAQVLMERSYAEKARYLTGDRYARHTITHMQKNTHDACIRCEDSNDLWKIITM